MTYPRHMRGLDLDHLNMHCGQWSGFSQVQVDVQLLALNKESCVVCPCCRCTSSSSNCDMGVVMACACLADALGSVEREGLLLLLIHVEQRSHLGRRSVARCHSLRLSLADALGSVEREGLVLLLLLLILVEQRSHLGRRPVARCHGLRLSGRCLGFCGEGGIGAAAAANSR
jgi:hypothetical protein